MTYNLTPIFRRLVRLIYHRFCCVILVSIKSNYYGCFVYFFTYKTSIRNYRPCIYIKGIFFYIRDSFFCHRGYCVRMHSEPPTVSCDNAIYVGCGVCNLVERVQTAINTWFYIVVVVYYKSRLLPSIYNLHTIIHHRTNRWGIGNKIFNRYKWTTFNFKLFLGCFDRRYLSLYTTVLKCKRTVIFFTLQAIGYSTATIGTFLRLSLKFKGILCNTVSLKGSDCLFGGLIENFISVNGKKSAYNQSNKGYYISYTPCFFIFSFNPLFKLNELWMPIGCIGVVALIACAMELLIRCFAGLVTWIGCFVRILIIVSLIWFCHYCVVRSL